MPFASKRQQRMAFARKLPFAKRWAKQTDFAALPESKDAGIMPAMIGGPGGLMATPGMGGRKWGNRKKLKGCTCGVNVATKEQIAPGITRIRGNLCNVHGRYGPCDAAQSGKRRGSGKGRKPAKAKKPVLTLAQRQAAREKQQAANRTKVLSGLGIDAGGQAALEALRSGKQGDSAAIDRAGLVKAGLVEKAQDGSYRLTASGRAMLNAASQGDQGRAGDTISSARDRTSAREQRQTAAQQRTQAAAARKQQVEERRKKAAAERAKKQSGGQRSSASSSSSSSNREAERQQDRAKRQAEHEADRKQRQQEHAQDRAQRQAEHAQDRAQRQADRQSAPQKQRSGSPSGPKSREQTTRVDTSRPGVKLPYHKRVKRSRAVNMGTVATKAGNPGDYLIVEDRTKPTTWHLQVKKNGKPDHGLMGSAWAALHSGFRGNVYSGPGKGEAIAKLRKLYKAEKMDIPGEKSFTVFKSADGSYRWIARSTTAYRDRDKEILPIATLDTDSQRMTKEKQYGPLRWWHLGNPDPFNADNPAGPGVDLGDCDFSMQIGTARVESGTFKSAALAQRIADTADQYELSPGFFHPIDQPQPDGTYTAIRTFERSLVPVKFGRASNLFTGLTVKEFRMDATEQARRFNAAVDQLGLTPDQAKALSSVLTQTDKSAALAVDPATGKVGVAYKSDETDPWAAVTAALKAAVMPPTAVAAATPPVADDKAAGDEASEDPAMEDSPEDQAQDEGDYLGDMNVADFEAMLNSAIQSALAPLVKGIDISGKMAQHMSELKDMMGGYATKDDSRATEIATLKTEQEKLAKRLAELEGDQPAVSMKDVQDALTGKPADPPTEKPVRDPSNPIASWAAATWPELYGANNS